MTFSSYLTFNNTNVIRVGLHTRKFTRLPRTVPDNDTAATPDLRELIACVYRQHDARQSCRINMQPHTGHVAMPAAGVIDTGS